MISIIVLITEIAFLMIRKALGFDQIYRTIATAFILFFTIAFIYDTEHIKKLSYLRTPLRMAYYFRMFLLFFDLYGQWIMVLPNSGGDADVFYGWAENYMKEGGWTRTVFPKVMGFIMRYVGQSRLYMQFLVMLCSIMSICAFAYIIYDLDIAYNVKYRAVAIVGILPNFAILSSIFLRESIVTMLLTLSITCFIIWFKGYSFLWIFLAALFDFTAAIFHSGAAGLVLGYMVVLLLYDQKWKRYHINIINIIPIVIMGLVVTFLYLNYAETFFGKLLSIDTLSDVANTTNLGASSYLEYVGNSNSIGNMVLYTIPRIVYFLFSPFPWQWRGIRDIIAFVFSSIFYLWAVKDAIDCIRHHGKHRNLVLALLIILFCVVFVFAWGVSNTGTATRHREKMVIIFGLLWALSHDGNRDRWIKLGNIILM